MLHLIHSCVTRSFQCRFTAFLALKAPATQKYYTRIIKHLRERIGPLEMISEDAAFEYTAERRRELADSSLIQEVRWLHGIWRHCLPRKSNPWAEVLQSLPRYCKEIRPTRPVSFEEVHKYLSKEPEGKTELRDKTIIALGFICALRRRELQQLNFNSVRHTEGGTVYLELPHSKSGATERVPVSEPARKYLASLLLVRASQGAGGDDALFVNHFYGGKRKNTRLSYECIGKIFKRELGIAPHRARCTAICKLRADGVDVDEVRRFARLRSAQMVLLYDRREIALEKIETPRF